MIDLQTYYKVLRKTKDGIYTSAVISKGKYCLTYNIDQETKSILPGGIFVFDSYVEALNFKQIEELEYADDKTTDGLYIFHVKITGNEVIKPVFYGVNSLLISKIDICGTENYWFPHGTHCFESIIPTRIVYS